MTNPLVSVAWLASRLDDPGTVVLDATLAPVGVTPPVDTRAHYRATHIPGAVFFDIDVLSDHATPLPHMLPAEQEFSRSMEALGIGDRMTIVVYEQEEVFSAPRAWWMLRAFGAREVFVLDGGLRAWMDAGLRIDSGEVSRPPASFVASLKQAAVEEFAGIQEKIAAGSGQIVDARSAGRFAGTAPEPRPGIRSGHMPGAINIPFTELSEGGRLKSTDALGSIFRLKGLDLTQPVVTTCGSGVTAAVLALGLELAGASKVSLYDGSWAEYAQRAGAAIETTP